MENNRNDGFKVPPGYGEAASRRLAEKLACVEEIRAYEKLFRLHKSNPFSVPENYFAGIMEVQSLAYLLEEDKGTSFILPEQYSADRFTMLNVVVDVPGNKENKRIKNARVLRLSRPFLRVLAASLILVSGIYFWHSYNVPLKKQDCGSLACLEKADVLKSGEIESLNVEDLLLLIKDEEIEKGLKPGNPETGDTISRDNHVKSFKENV